jgi:hypothetical protein
MLESQRRENQIKREALRTMAADDVEATRKSFEDTVRTKIGLNVDYDLEIGAPEIDVNHLRLSMQQYDTELVAYDQTIEAIRKRNELDLQLATEANIRAILDGNEAVSQVGFWTKDKKDKCVPDCGAPVAPLRSQPIRKGPDRPKMGPLRMTVPITVRIGGNGNVEDSMTRRTEKPVEPTRKGPCVPKCVPCKPECAVPAPAACDPPGDSVNAIPLPARLRNLFARPDEPAFDDVEDTPAFEGDIPNALVPPPFEPAAELPRDTVPE